MSKVFWVQLLWERTSVSDVMQGPGEVGAAEGRQRGNARAEGIPKGENSELHQGDRSGRLALRLEGEVQYETLVKTN